MLITEGRDFGELVYARGHSAAGVVFIKFPSHVRGAKPAAVVEVLAKLDLVSFAAFLMKPDEVMQYKNKGKQRHYNFPATCFIASRPIQRETLTL
ncbi:MAG: hypothetical protein JO166_11460 [Deltaproteobacteria bacterium]|nr:hypothetical protein [Deltaproteobacteria bacterium]